MNTQELTMMLARIQVLDNRQVDELTIQAWQPLMADVRYEDAVEAVNAHFRDSTDYLQPAHIVRAVKSRNRLALTMSPEAPDSCAPGMHRRVADGTCLHCTDRPG